MSWVDVGGLTPGATIPKDLDDYLPIRSVPQRKSRFGFSKVIANGVDSDFGNVFFLGNGQTVAQAGGALVITSGTTNYAETIIRGADQLFDAFNLRWSTVLSQRIANQAFIVELVDIIGNNLAYTINNTTSVTVTIPNNPFTAVNVGQTMSWFSMTSTAITTPTTVPATIASVSGNDVTFTMGWSLGFSSGTGTCTLFGWNYHRFTYDGTSATSFKYQTQRNGWPGTSNTPASNTTASPGHVCVYNVEDGVATVLDHLRATATSSVLSLRAQAFQDLADGTIPMVLQLRVPNGNAPASGTTWTLAFIDYEQYAPQQVSLVSARPMNPTPQYVAVQGTPGVYTFYTASVGTMYSLTTTASTNAANIRNAKAVLGEVTISNVTATACYVKFYNKSSSPTVGTDIPVLTIPVPANTTVNMAFGLGKAFSTGLSIAVTAGAAATDTANAVAGVQISATYV